VQRSRKAFEYGRSTAAPPHKPACENSRSESVYDPDILKTAKIAQFVRSYLLTLRMHNETGEMGTYELLEGINYTEKTTEDPDYEDMIMGLIDTLETWSDQDASTIEQEVNRMIGRNIWKCQVVRDVTTQSEYLPEPYV